MEILKTRRDIAPPERPAAKIAIFMNGADFNYYAIGNSRTLVTGLVRLPERLTDTPYDVSADGSPYPILCWIPYDTPGPIYWFSEADHVLLNTDTARMFQEFTALTALDFSEIGASANMRRSTMMFESCRSLARIIAPRGFVAPSESLDMFYGCLSLVGGSGTRYDGVHTDGEYARIDNPPDAPGYFTRAT